MVVVNDVLHRKLFENLVRFRPSSRKRVASVYQKSSLWRAFFKRCVFGDRFHLMRVDGRPNWRKKIAVSNKNGYVRTGPELAF